MKIVLGSSSIFRRKILEDAGISFEVVSPDIDEKKIRTTDNAHTPVVLSYAKAQAAAEKVLEPAIIIACDQVILCNGNILEKPESPQEIRAWYDMYAKYPVEYVNGVTVFNTETKSSLTAQEISIVVFKEIPDSFIEEQIKKGDILVCCGALGDDTEENYGTIIQGSKQGTIGLPLELVLDMIEKIK